MSSRPAHPKRVLAIDPTSRGFGFVVLETSTSLIDWGGKSTRIEKEGEALSKIVALIHRYQPETIVIEDCQSSASRRCERVKHLLESIGSLAISQGLECRRVCPAKLKHAFKAFGGTTKQEIAQSIAAQLPELAPRLPRIRKAWMNEAHSMAIFDAAALALTTFYSRVAWKR